MIAYKPEELALATGGTVVQSGAAVTSVSTDSRTVGEGQLFIPLVGENFDGHAYIDMALEKGAAGCLCSRVPETLQSGKFYVQVADTAVALRDLSGHYRARFDIPVVQVSGSAGKTTTKEMIASVLGQHFRTLKTQGNLNNQFGTPRTLLQLEPGHEAAVIETGIGTFGDLRYLKSAVQPTVAVLTNVGDAHIENMNGSRLGVLQAKSEIFEGLREGGLAVLNGDDELLGTLDLPFTTLRCGRSENCNVRVTDIVDRGIEGIDCAVTTAKDTYRLEIPSPGDYMIDPASMATAIGEYLGMSKSEIIAGVAAYVSTGSRMRRIRLPGERLIIDDCYNANPQAMQEALRILAKSDKRKLAILGDMGELGDLAPAAHRAAGELAASLGLDAVVAIGPKSADIAVGGGSVVRHFLTIEEALSTIRELFTPGTTVLVKASHAMGFGKIVKELEETYQ